MSTPHQTSESTEFFERDAKAYSLGELPDFVQEFVTHVEPGAWVFLNGDLGAGKTLFVSEVALTLGVPSASTSPTFAILQSLLLPQPIGGLEKLLHLDLYRIKSGKELCYLGLETEFTANSIAFFEWAELVSHEDWEQFFLITGCIRPKQVWEMQIVPTQGGHARMYSFLDRSEILL